MIRAVVRLLVWGAPPLRADDRAEGRARSDNRVTARTGGVRVFSISGFHIGQCDMRTASSPTEIPRITLKSNSTGYVATKVTGGFEIKKVKIE